MPYQLDFSQWPILIVEMSGVTDDETVQNYIRDNERILEKKEPYVLLVEGSKNKLFKPEHRRMLAAWNAEHHDQLKTYRVGLAYVAKSMATRGMLTAIYWISPPPYPYKFFATMDEALGWSRNLLE